MSTPMSAARPLRTWMAAALASLSGGCRPADSAPTSRVTEAQVADYARSLDAEGRIRLLRLVDGAGPERGGVIGRGEGPQTLLGPDLPEGHPAPAFRLTSPEMAEVRSEDFAGKLLVLSVVPSIDTRVCEAQTGRMAALQKQLPEGARLLTVSRDLPQAQRRFLETNGFDTPIASDYRDGSFGRAFGLVVKEGGLLARSAWVVDPRGRIAYRELVKDQGTEPDYPALLAAVARVAGPAAAPTSR